MNKLKRLTYTLLSNRLVNNYLENHQQKKLQIGCGENLLKNWLNTDLTFTRKKVAFLDAGKNYKFKNETFAYIFSEHIIEHLSFEEAVNMLSECYRTLKPGGVLRIATPDFNFLMKLYTSPETPNHKAYIQWASSQFIGNISSQISDHKPRSVFVINNFFKDWGHQIVYDYNTIKIIMEQAGFKSVKQYEPGKSDIQELCNLESHGNIIPSEFNLLETMVLEGTK